jgi:hypothetical protein
MASGSADEHAPGDPHDHRVEREDAARAVMILFAELPTRLRELEAGLDRQRLDGVRDVAKMVKETIHDGTSPELRQAAREILGMLDNSRTLAPLREELAPLVALCRDAMKRTAPGGPTRPDAGTGPGTDPGTRGTDA